MSMVIDEVVAKALEEIKLQSWGVTEQFLQVHQLVYTVNGGATQSYFAETDVDSNRAAVYFKVVGERFYFTVYFGLSPQIEIIGTGTEPHHEVFFKATSTVLTGKQIAEMTSLVHTRIKEKGDEKGIRGVNGKWNHSTVDYDPYPGPGTFEKRLAGLLDFLEQDRTGVKELVEKAEGYIQIIFVYHNGNTMLGGPAIDKTAIKRLAALDLSIDFDQYAHGNFYKD